MENKALIQLENISAGYENKPVLHDVNLTVFKNDFLGIIGPNGGGKTTLVKLMLGLLRPTTGRIRFYRDGHDVKTLRIGYLPQQNLLDAKFPVTVRDVILSGLLGRHRIIHAYRRADYDRAAEVMQELELTDLARRSFGELSGGQRQRVLIGRALVCRPEVLFLDEPNTYIDRPNEENLYRLLEQINHHCAVVLVSHDLGTVLQEVRNIACVNYSVHYHAATDVTEQELSEAFGCPFELIAHGHLPHRILPEHAD